MFIIKAVAKILTVVMLITVSLQWSECEAAPLIKNVANNRSTIASISNYSTLNTENKEKLIVSADGSIHKEIIITQDRGIDLSKYKEISMKDKVAVQTINYNPENLRELSNLTSGQIAKILESSDLKVLSEAYAKMEKKYNVNVFFLMALNIEESGYGTSYLAQNNNNLGGIKLRSGGYASFESWEESLDYIANLIDTMYLTESGPYYYGTSVYDVNVKYCEGKTWARNLNTIAYELMNKVEPIVPTNVRNFSNY